MLRGWVLVVALWPTSAWAADYVVTRNDDAGPGTLRDAVDLANGDPGRAPHRITFALGGPSTIELESPIPYLTVVVTINGVDGSAASRQPCGTPHQLEVTIRAAYGTDDGILRSTAPSPRTATPAPTPPTGARVCPRASRRTGR